MIAGLRGEDSIAELCRKEGINQNLYYLLPFVEGLPGDGQERLAGDTAREATSDEVKEVQAQARQLKELVAELMIENRLLKKACSAMGSPVHEVQRCRETGDHPAGRAVLIVGESAERFQSREHDERHNSPSPYLLKPLEC